MSRALRAWLSTWFTRPAAVEVSSCVHFCGFRYGCDHFNPYEDYLQALTAGCHRDAARQEFIGFLQHYRPRDFGEALGVALRRSYPLWLYPWSRRTPPPAWQPRQEDCPDLLTHFTPAGIARARIEAEFAWLERALESIRMHGFQPERFRAPILARRLVKADGRVAWLLLDGNHRVAALSALGIDQVRLRYFPIATVSETGLPRWNQVRNGRYDAGDARLVLNQYFAGNRRPWTGSEPAPLLEDDR